MSKQTVLGQEPDLQQVDMDSTLPDSTFSGQGKGTVSLPHPPGPALPGCLVNGVLRGCPQPSGAQEDLPDLQALGREQTSESLTARPHGSLKA